jgi:hypothetical protein
VFISANILFIFGGHDGSNGRRDCFTYTFGENEPLQIKANMNKARYWHCGYFLDNIVYAFGAYQDKTAEKYSVEANQWQDLPPMPFESSVSPFTVALHNGALFIVC